MAQGLVDHEDQRPVIYIYVCCQLLIKVVFWFKVALGSEGYLYNVSESLLIVPRLKSEIFILDKSLGVKFNANHNFILSVGN